MTSKVEVKGKGAHPFYVWMKQQLGQPAEPTWNFHKLLLGKDGQALKAFDPRTEPLSADVTSAIEGAL